MKTILTLLISLFIYLGHAQVDDWVIGETTLQGREVIDDLEIPWELLWISDNELWWTERGGKVWTVSIDNGEKRLLLDISDRMPVTGSEPGLLGMVLHPDFHISNLPKVFMAYNYNDEDFNILERLSQFSYLDGELKDEVVLIDSIPGNSNHNGARMVITEDNKILMTTGDYQNPASSQDSLSLNGKLLRMNLDGSIPDDNPIPNSYVYALGLRNSQGLHLASNGVLYSTEHGPRESDEVNILREGANYGWPSVQGACDTQDEMDFCNEFSVTEPIWEWTPTIAVNDLVYYDHPAIPELKNCLLIASLGGFRGVPGLYQMVLSEDGLSIEEEIVHLNFYGRIRDVCVNPNNGTIYFVDNGVRYPGTSPNSIYEFIPISINNDETEDKLELSYFSPSTDLKINTAQSGLSFKVFAPTGIELKKGELQAGINKINVSSLPTGPFICVVYDGLNILKSNTFLK